MRDIKALFIPTLCSGVTYWRMFNPVKAAIKTGAFGAHLVWWQKALNEIHPWQFKLESRELYATILNELEAAVRCADIVVMGMIHTEAGLHLVRAIREMHGKPVVMETDDNILSTPTYNPANEYYDPSSKLRILALEQMRESDAVITTTPHLKESYSEFNPNIYICPNSLDFNLWGKARRKASKGKIVVGWSGGASHNADLDNILPAVKYFANKYPELVEFKILHGISPELRKYPNVTWVSKFEEILKYPQHIAKQGFDIAVAPLVDNNFNRSKSNLRWLEAAAFGVPCVASNVGHFKDTITHGVDGLLCDTPQDFIANIESLINDRSLRKKIGAQAHITARKKFNIDTTVLTYRDIFNEVLDRGQVKKTLVEKESNFKIEAEII